MIHVGLPINLFYLAAIPTPFTPLNSPRIGVLMRRQETRYAVAELRPANDDEKDGVA